MTYDEILAYLKERDMTMSRYEREDWDHFVEKIHLQLTFPFIHITGSNGKGSTANYIYQIYQAAGYKTAPSSPKAYFYRVKRDDANRGANNKRTWILQGYSPKKRKNQSQQISPHSRLRPILPSLISNEQNPMFAIIEWRNGRQRPIDQSRRCDSFIEASSTTGLLEHTPLLWDGLSARLPLNTRGHLSKKELARFSSDTR